MDIMEMLKSVLELNLSGYLESIGAAPWVINLIGVLNLATACMLIVIFLIWLERKVIARMQDRIGPNRVGGKYGLLQSVADATKLLSKELITPAGVDWLPYNLAPILIVVASLLTWAVIPLAPGVIGVDLNIAVFFVLAISSISVVTFLLAGWGSNNKYALLGAFRAVAQMVSYEVPMIVALLIPILLARSMSTVDIVEAQGIPFIIVVPLSALIFFISALAETGRTPFDLLEADSEIVAGFHIEYSGMKFAMFFLAEFLGTLFMSAFFVVIYLGGYRFFGLEEAMIGDFHIGPMIGFIAFATKVFLVYFVFIWIRATLPRVRIDQLLNFNWKFLVPLSLVLLLTVAVMDKLFLADASTLTKAVVLMVTNIVVGWITIELLRWRNRDGETAVISESVDDAHGHNHDAHEAVATH